MMSTTVVLGGGGLLGNMLVRVFREYHETVLAFDLPDIDVLDGKHLLAMLEAAGTPRPDVIVHAAGIGDLDWLESHPNTAWNVHVQGTRNARAIAERAGALFVLISCTECERGESVFAESKREAEAVAAGCERHLIVRCSSLFGPRTERSAKHLIDSVLSAVRRVRRFTAIDDLWSSPTYTRQLAESLLGRIRAGQTGRCTLASAGRATPAEIVRELGRASGLPIEVEPISHVDYGCRAPRSSDTSVPDGTLPHWTEALRAYLRDRQSPNPTPFM